jgi:inhibitor of cysteine peptidase
MRRLTFPLLLATLLTSACVRTFAQTSGEAYVPTYIAKITTSAYAVQSVQAIVGQSFDVSLPLDTAKGEIWVLGNRYNNAILKCMGYRINSNDQQPGATENDIWSFKVEKAGTTYLTLNRIPSGGTENHPEKTVYFAVQAFADGPHFTDSTKTIKVKQGQNFILQLASNPTTGYQWKLGKISKPQTAKLLMNQFNPPTDNARVGAGGNEWWVFGAKKKGSTTITLNYLRVWEKNTPPAQKAIFTVKVY